MTLRKCGHDFLHINVYGHCARYDRIGVRTVVCICSEYESQDPPRCETCKKHRIRYD